MPSLPIRAVPRFMRALQFAAPQRRAIAAIIALTVVAGAIGALDPLLLKVVVDGVIERRPSGALFGAVAALLGLVLLREAVLAFSNWLTWRTRLRVQYDILDATVSRLHGLSVSFHRNEPVGATMSRLDRGIQGIVGAFSELAFNVIPALVFLVLAGLMMVRLDWRLFLVVLAFVPLPALLGAWAAPRQTDRDRQLLNRWSRIYARFNEVLSGIVTVKSFAMEHAEKDRFMSHVDQANQVVVRGVRFDACVTALQQSLTTVARVTVIGYGAYLAWQGQTSIGTLLAFLGYLGGLFGPVQGLTSVYQTLRRAAVSLDVVFSILDAKEKVDDQPDAMPVVRVEGRVTFDKVGFAYVAGTNVLDDVSFEVAPGQTIALVGPSGGGKTSVTALLQRLYDPDRGAIRIDGVDIRQLQASSLRRHIGVVMQDALLFNDTIRANIAYSRPNATQAEIEAAARAANAHEFIEKLPSGYDTEVGDRGALLSAGQRQRIAIARALLKQPAIVILDEATSALDAESEASVQEALERLLAGRTTFVIAHRLATVVRADRILVMRDGRITESGTHAELLAANGTYTALARLQSRGLVLPAA